MPSVLDRSALEQSPLADLHLLANELGVDGFRRLRKPELVDAILEPPVRRRAPSPRPTSPSVDEPERRSRGRADDDDAPKRSRRGRRGGRGRRRDEERRRRAPIVDRDEPVAGRSAVRATTRLVEGAVELLANGSGLPAPRAARADRRRRLHLRRAGQALRARLGRQASAARCARRGVRSASRRSIRVDTINGRPAEEVAEGTRFEDLPVAWPDERIELGSDDPTVKAIEWLTPFGKGSRVRHRRRRRARARARRCAGSPRRWPRARGSR